MPASSIRARSSGPLLAVRATIAIRGTPAAVSRRRISRTVAGPSSPGIIPSRNTRSNGSAGEPRQRLEAVARPPPRRRRERPSRRPTTRRLSALSSATSTRGRRVGSIALTVPGGLGAVDPPIRGCRSGQARVAARAPTRSIRRRPNSAASTSTAKSAFGGRPVVRRQSAIVWPSAGPPMRRRRRPRAPSRPAPDRGPRRPPAGRGRRPRRSRRSWRGTRSRSGARRRGTGSRGCWRPIAARARRARARGPVSRPARLPARRASATTSSLVRRACSVTSRPSQTARGVAGSALIAARQAAEGDPRRLRVAVHVPLADRRRVARDPERAAHADPAPEEPRQRGLDEDRDREVGQRPERDQRDLSGPPAGLLDDEVRAEPRGERGRWLRQLRVAEAVRAVRLGRDLERAEAGASAGPRPPRHRRGPPAPGRPACSAACPRVRRSPTGR